MCDTWPRVQITDHPEHGTFQGELLYSWADWPWWVVGVEHADGRREAIGVHADFVTPVREG